MAIYDWETLAQAKVYTDAVDRKRVASKGSGKVATVKDERRSPKNRASVPPRIRN
jgi:hypothetical protein